MARAEALRQELQRLTSGQRWTAALSLGALAVFLSAGLPSARVVDDDRITGTLEEPAGVDAPAAPAPAAAPAPPPFDVPSPTTDAPLLAIADAVPADTTPTTDPVGDTGPAPPAEGDDGEQPEPDDCERTEDPAATLACAVDGLGLPRP